jgi:outer membrane protein OmpA-like peptidoglycan-associated protein
MVACSKNAGYQQESDGNINEVIEMLEVAFSGTQNKVLIREQMDLLFAIYNIDHKKLNYLAIGNRLVGLRKESKGNYSEMDLIEILISAIPNIMQFSSAEQPDKSLVKQLQLLSSSIHKPPAVERISYSPISRGRVSRTLINTKPKPFKFENILFDFNQFRLHAKSIGMLKRIHKYLKKNEDVNLEIAGHTDTVGSEKYNMNLSKKRLRETAEYLLDKGIYEDRMQLYAFGESEPLYTKNNPPKSKEDASTSNRRVEFSDTKKFSRSPNGALVVMDEPAPILSDSQPKKTKKSSVKDDTDAIVYKIQVGAFKNPHNFNGDPYQQFGNLEHQKVKDLTVITVGRFSSFVMADKTRQYLIQLGNTGLFITAEHKGKRKYLSELPADPSMISLRMIWDKNTLIGYNIVLEKVFPFIRTIRKPAA